LSGARPCGRAEFKAEAIKPVTKQKLSTPHSVDRTDRDVVPDYKHTYANVCRVGTIEEYSRTVSLKNRSYVG
jgi:hypothetical protein